MTRKMILVGLIVLFAHTASAQRVEKLHWTYPPAEASRIAGFRAYKGTAPSVVDYSVDAGKPTPDANNVYEFSLPLPDTGNVYFAVTAYAFDVEGDKGGEMQCDSGQTSCTLHWNFTSPANAVLKHFNLYRRIEPAQTYSPPVDIGIPSIVNGEYQITVTAPAAGTKFYALTVVMDVQSDKSNEICSFNDGPCPGPAAQGVVTGFALWDAETHTLVDADFRSGENIPAAVADCAAIEIKVNAYLAVKDGPGVIVKTFDSGPSAEETKFPYGWETDASPSSQQCAPSLSVAGNHTLEVQPYDDEAKLIPGIKAAVSFSVGSTPPIPTLGAPGKPIVE